MQQLIALQQTTIDGEGTPTVNARELHAFLGCRTNFRDWIKKRIEDYGFVEDPLS